MLAAKAARDFLLELHHAPVLLGLIVGEGHGGIDQETQHVLVAAAQPQEQIVPGSALGPTPVFAQRSWGPEWRLGLVERDTLGDDGLETSLDERDQAGF